MTAQHTLPPAATHASDARIGIDLGGTKIEGILMQPDGNIANRLRLATPQDDYAGTLQTIADIVTQLESAHSKPLRVGICTPGALSPQTGLLKNSNSVCLNGMPFLDDLQKTLQREVQMANDANCLALSESVDGAGAGAAVVFAVIIGTGIGGGIVVNGKVLNGCNAISGEWGHNPLPWRRDDELPGPVCYCGRHGCNETFLSGAWLEKHFFETSGKRMLATEIEQAAANGDAQAEKMIATYEDRLARGLASVVNFLDPDVVVLGGGMSNMLRLYDNLPKLMHPWVFGGDFTTPIRRAKHGDSSGVRGAAWLA